MAAQNTQAIDIPSQRRESAFLSLSPFQSTPHASPMATKPATSPVNDNASSVTDVIEPVQKVQRSGSESSESSDASASSASGSFLKLNALREE
ncbi:hypothetical protein LTR85_012229 [Meristemomyces frigidus]|nr:hypothetical protein LTR85_012229 [Meristemomyces frigidus]